MLRYLLQSGDKIRLVLLYSILGFAACSQDYHAVLQEAQTLETNLNEQAALEKYRTANKLQPSQILPIVKCAELFCRIGYRLADKNKRDHFYLSAKNYAAAAIKLQPTNSDAHCCMAMALGRLIINQRGNEQIAIVKEIKFHITQSLKYNPDNYKAWHVLGRWHYELAQLNFIERTAVKLFYGGLPDYSLQASIEAFEKCLKIQPYFLLNYVELAKAYLANGQQEKALIILKDMIKMPEATEDDGFLKKQAKGLISELQ